MTKVSKLIIFLSFAIPAMLICFFYLLMYLPYTQFKAAEEVARKQLIILNEEILLPPPQGVEQIYYNNDAAANSTVAHGSGLLIQYDMKNVALDQTISYYVDELTARGWTAEYTEYAEILFINQQKQSCMELRFYNDVTSSYREPGKYYIDIWHDPYVVDSYPKLPARFILTVFEYGESVVLHCPPDH